jgi:hypothetical protein
VVETDRACECGELLQPWRTIAYYGETLRQRGLALARRQDYLGACLSFVQASLSNPLDERSRADVIRSLVRLGRFQDAKELTQLFSGKISADEAAALDDAMAQLATAEAARAKPDADRQETSSEPSAADVKPSAREFLGLPALARQRGFLARLLTPPVGDAL